MAWVEFPFPQCPSCATTWNAARHLDCPFNGLLDIDPDSHAVRCRGCSSQWNVWRTDFHCSCGHSFASADVRSALDEIVRAAGMLARILDENRRELARIQEAGDISVRRWLQKFAEGFAGGLGRALARVINAFFGGPT